jgi:hypothetical protein
MSGFGTSGHISMSDLSPLLGAKRTSKDSVMTPSGH